MAQRMATVWVTVGEPDMNAAEECPACGFDALLSFPLTFLSEAGVTANAATCKACARCRAEEEDVD